MSEGDLNKSNGDVFYSGDVDALLTSIGRLNAQQAYENGVSNVNYLGYDIFTDSNGAKNTVDTTNTNSKWNSSNYFEFLKVDDEINDSSYSEYWTETETGGTISEDTDYLSVSTSSEGPANTEEAQSVGGSTSDLDYYNAGLITKLKCRVALSASRDAGSSSATARARWGLTDGTNFVWIKTVERINTELGSEGDDSVWVLYIDTDNQTVDVYDDGGLDQSNLDISSLSSNYYVVIQSFSDGVGTGGADMSSYARIYYLYSALTTDTITVETNTIIDEVVPNNIVIYGDVSTPTNTSITVDVSDDGGSTWSITDQELDTQIDTSSFSTGNLALKFNLATTDTSVTPTISGYGVAITH